MEDEKRGKKFALVLSDSEWEKLKHLAAELEVKPVHVIRQLIQSATISQVVVSRATARLEPNPVPIIKAKVIEAFREYGPMSLMKCAAIIEVHPHKIRKIVEPPLFRIESIEKTGRHPKVIWTLNNV